MGRRALKRIDKDLDYSWHLLAFDDLPNPVDGGSLFDRPGPLEIEVGSGKGLFMRTASGQRPEHNFLGVEIAYGYARHAAARLAQRERTNARMLAGDGQRLLREFVPDDSLEAVHVYFPDPWWKKRHHKRRVLNEEFLLQVARTMRPGGRLHFWTDVQDYYTATLELIAERIPLAGPFPVEARPAEDDLDYHTHFERRTRLAEQPVYRAEFEKQS
jgi:tRNA (guanine-N7-)-methyltransferase